MGWMMEGREPVNEDRLKLIRFIDKETNELLGIPDLSQVQVYMINTGCSMINTDYVISVCVESEP